jgi:hypothetical protein
MPCPQPISILKIGAIFAEDGELLFRKYICPGIQKKCVDFIIPDAKLYDS